MMITHCLGFPRIGTNRELKKSLEQYWRGQCDADNLLTTASMLRMQHWTLQAGERLSLVTVGDFSLYDHILDTACMFNVIPQRFQGETDPLKRYFDMARGNASQNIAPMEMTKWFDTNYHYTVPEFSSDTELKTDVSSLLAQIKQANEAGYATKTVLPGPATLLKLGKSTTPAFNRWSLAEKLATCYAEAIETLLPHTPWIQLDEPALALDLSPEEKSAFAQIYEMIAQKTSLSRVILTTYFGPIDHNASLLTPFHFGGIHLDLVRGPEQLQRLQPLLPRNIILSLGVVDGRNIWRSEYEKILPIIEQAGKLFEAVWLGSSCSLLHTPIDLDDEAKIDPEIRAWMAFAKQKCRELNELKEVATNHTKELLEANRAAWKARRHSVVTNNPKVRNRLELCDHTMLSRHASWSERSAIQHDSLRLPPLPTTTIGSFPQTPELRKIRRRYKQGELSHTQYTDYIKHYIHEVVELQTELDLDVLVHGEPERNDMVEYFGQQLDGYCFTENGWVQSYGSRCVKPPIIYGDVSRPKPMTIEWTTYAQSLTKRPMKGMLTGPVTMLCWSFVRDDQPRQATCRQIALALRDEVADLEKAGIQIIQIDEAAFREGLPLRQCGWDAYLRWAVDCFRLTSCVVENHTQIHTHMCYSEFNDIIPWIARMDADVISIEASRSRMEILDAFNKFAYPNEIGPGVYDIHSERVPPPDEMVLLIEAALRILPLEKLWINPDCGLKTRGWEETEKALQNMLLAAKKVRLEHSQ